MENNEETGFDTELDDDEAEQIDEYVLHRITFDEQLISHRSNRLNQTFGQINVPCKSEPDPVAVNEDQTLVPSRCKTPLANVRIQIYENSCQTLDVTIDWQLRSLLQYDNIAIADRALCFNDIRAFATAIEANLESLTLHSVGLTSRSINVLCQALIKCVHLNLLDLSCNQIRKAGFESLAETIIELPSLKYLSLAGCSIRDGSAVRLGDICRHENLAEINLSGNELEEMACIFIGNALTENQALVYLNLSWNRIRSFGAIALFRGFEINTTLTDLDLSWSGLGYDGSVALRRVFTVSKSLRRINISHCNIDWTSAKLISEGLAKNSTLETLILAFNPLTTHGVQHLIKALDHPKNGVSMFDISGVTVLSSTVRLAESIAARREFTMRYDCEVPVHDMYGRPKGTQGDAMNKVVRFIDERKWRTMEYFRMLDKRKQLQLESDTITEDIIKSGVKLEDHEVDNIHRRLTRPEIQPLTYKNLNVVIQQQRMRDRSRKARQEKQEKDLQKRNQKILQAVNRHFPDIDVVSKEEQRKGNLERLARPRTYSGKSERE